MTRELLYKVGEETIYQISIFKCILTSQNIKYIDVSNVHHSFSRYKKKIE